MRPRSASRSSSRTSAARPAPSASAASRARRPTATPRHRAMGHHMANGAIYSLQYDLMKDFEPVALIATQPILIVASKNIRRRTFKELIAWLKANTDKASQGNSGVGTPQPCRRHLSPEHDRHTMQIVPYRGAGLSMQDLMAGNIDVMLDTPAVSLPQVRGGNIKAYAVTAKNRIWSRPRFRPPTRRACPASIFRSGTRSGCRRARRRRSSPSSTRRRRRRWPIRRIEQKLVDLARNLPARSARRRRRCAPSTRPRSTSGGRSSRPPASRRSEDDVAESPACAALASPCGGVQTPAQTYPSKPITIIVPFAAGGPSDALARISAERMGRHSDNPSSSRTSTGAGGIIGVGRAVRAPADGYTFSFGMSARMC